MTLEGNPLPPDVGHEVRFHRVTETCAGSEPVMRVEWVEDDAQPEIVPGHLDLPPRTLWMWSKPGPGPKCPGSGRKK